MSDLIVERSDGAALMAHDERERAALMSLNPIPRDRAWVQLYLLREWGFEPYLIEGKRSLERQKQLVAQGKSKTLKSKHLTGDAWDIVLLDHGWDAPREFWNAVGRSARIVGAVWGGQWRTFPDPCHCQFEGGKIVG